MFKYAANYEYDLINLIWCHPEKTSHLLGFSGCFRHWKGWPASLTSMRPGDPFGCGARTLQTLQGTQLTKDDVVRCRTMSYDVVRCRKMSYDVNKALGMWPLKSQISPETATETGCKMLKTAKLHPVRVRCRGSLPVRRKNMEKSFFWSCVLSPFVKFCKPSISHMVSKGSGLDM